METKSSALKIEKYFTSKSMQIRMIVLWSMVSSLLWVGLFAMGLLINSQPYRDSLGKHFYINDFMMCIATYTPTNIALLCLIAAYIGGCASKLIINSIESKAEQPINIADKTSSHLYMSESPLSSMLRGMVVYFAYIAGVCIANANLFDAPTLSAYVKSAGIVSLLSFIMGYDPTMFHTFINLAEKVDLKGKK
jgi:hypothetical protein